MNSLHAARRSCALTPFWRQLAFRKRSLPSSAGSTKPAAAVAAAARLPSSARSSSDGGGGGGGGGRRGRGREAAEKPRLPGPVSARLVPVGGATQAGRAVPRSRGLSASAGQGAPLGRPARPAKQKQTCRASRRWARPRGGRSRVEPLLAFGRRPG